MSNRPEFMVALGVMPPYTVEDVKQAYLTKVHHAHPDHGGSVDRFRELQEAYEHAQQYVQFRTNKRVWIAAQMERYTAQQDIESRLKSYGAKISFASTDWLQKSFGDFAELSNSFEEIHLVDSKYGRDAIDLIVTKSHFVSGVKRLVFRNCQLRDEDALRLVCFQVLSHLDLSGNSVTGRVVDLAVNIGTLQSLEISETAAGWASRVKLSLLMRRRQQQKPTHLSKV